MLCLRTMSETHEATYRRTIDTFVQSVESGQFTDAAVPRLTEQLRQELGQCMELCLISSAFYAERMEVLGNVMALLN